jgi:hypothetical protein
MTENDTFICISYDPDRCKERCKVSAPIDVEYCWHMLAYGTVFWTKENE